MKIDFSTITRCALTFHEFHELGLLYVKIEDRNGKVDEFAIDIETNWENYQGLISGSHMHDTSINSHHWLLNIEMSKRHTAFSKRYMKSYLKGHWGSLEETDKISLLPILRAGKLDQVYHNQVWRDGYLYRFGDPLLRAIPLDVTIERYSLNIHPFMLMMMDHPQVSNVRIKNYSLDRFGHNQSGCIAFSYTPTLEEFREWQNLASWSNESQWRVQQYFHKKLRQGLEVGAESATLS